MELFEAVMEAAPDDPTAFVKNRQGVDARVKKRALELLVADEDSHIPASHWRCHFPERRS